MEIGAPGILAQAPERQHSVGVPDRVLEGPPCVFAILHSVDVGKRLLTGYLHRKAFEKSASRLTTPLRHRVHSLE